MSARRASGAASKALRQPAAVIGGTAALLVLLALLAWLEHGVGEQGLRSMVRSSARLAVTLFSLAFSASSLHALRRSAATKWLLANRRYLGLSFALAHADHLAVLAALALRFPDPFCDELELQAVIGGGLAYVFVFAMAATSSDAAFRMLGARRWRGLHTLGSYYIWSIFAVSYFPLALESVWAVPFVVMLATALLLRITRRFFEFRASGCRSGSLDKGPRFADAPVSGRSLGAMDTKRYAVMGAGEVGCYLARTLSAEGHQVTLIDSDPKKQRMVEDQLDVGFVLGNGTHLETLRAAEVDQCELFVAASSSDEANLAASLLAKRVGVTRTVVRVATAEGVTKYGRVYESAFEVDLLLSTQLLTTTRILNFVLGYNTLDVEYLAGGAIQVRRTQVEAGSLLNTTRLADVDLPRGSLVLAFISGNELRVPNGSDRANAGDDAIMLGTSDNIDEVERRVSGHARRLGLVVIAGGGSTAHSVAAGLERQVKTIKIIESDRGRAEELAKSFPDYEIVHGDSTDMSVLTSEGVDQARAFIALTGHDESNLMACLLAQELGVRQITALVRKSDTSSLWRKVGLIDVVSPRTVAAERIRTYVENNYEPHIVSFANGAAQFMHRRVVEQSAAAGCTLENIEIPQGLVVAAVLHNGRAIVPRGDQKLEVGDEVILFVRQSEAWMAQLVFPGAENE